MQTVNSLSGGKSSSYIAINYPADYNVFSLVRTNDQNCIYPDKNIRQIVSDKIGKEFIGTLEDDNIIKIMLDLEQFIGSEITWLSGKTFDEIINGKNNLGKNGSHYLPNLMARYCTTELKMNPIFDWWKREINEVVEMRIGFRANETKRAAKMVSRLNQNGVDEMKTIIGKRKTQNKWGMVEWRIPKFPLIDDVVFKDKIEVFWNNNKEVRFGSSYFNNCVGCFHRNPIFLKKMADNHPNKMEWFAKQEDLNKPNQFKKEVSYKQIIKYKSQTELSFEDFGDCDSGYCGL
tara:strand:- start:261 stop:1130 length:870 start_codon:yes stop_codon:yes gene_type:complete